jgi:hypothetical protein
MLESQNFPNVQSVFASAAILGDFVDQHRDFGDWRIHPVQQAQFEGNRNLREAYTGPELHDWLIWAETLHTMLSDGVAIVRLTTRQRFQ